MVADGFYAGKPLSRNGLAPAGQIESTTALVDDTAAPDRLFISCHLLAVQIGFCLSAPQTSMKKTE